MNMWINVPIKDFLCFDLLSDGGRDWIFIAIEISMYAIFSIVRLLTWQIFNIFMAHIGIKKVYAIVSIFIYSHKDRF